MTETEEMRECVIQGEEKLVDQGLNNGGSEIEEK